MSSFWADKRIIKFVITPNNFYSTTLKAWESCNFQALATIASILQLMKVSYKF